MIMIGMVHEPQALTAYPIAIGAMAPPTFANVFMHPVTVPAYSPPMSWQTAQAGVMERSAIPAAAAINRAAAMGLPIIGAAARIKPLATREVAAPPHRTVRRAYCFDQWAVQNPPSRLAAGTLKRTALDRYLA